MESIIQALNLYRRGKKIVKAKRGQGQILVFPHRSLGDIYILSLYKNSGVKVFDDQYCLYVVGDTCKRLALMYGFENVFAVDELDMAGIVRYSMVEKNIKILHFLYYHTNISEAVIKKNKFNLVNCYSNFIFDKEIDYKKCMHKVKESDAKIIAEMGIKKNQSIIIAPYAKSVAALSYEFWLNFVNILRNEGFKRIYTNCAPFETELPGTEKLVCSIEDICSIVEYAGYFIGLRSGLCDVVSATSAKKIILYPKESYLDDSMNFYSLKMLPNVDNLSEFEILGMQIPIDEIMGILRS